MSTPKPKDKPFAIPKSLVWEAYRQVAANKGAPGVDAAGAGAVRGRSCGQPLQGLEELCPEAVDAREAEAAVPVPVPADRSRSSWHVRVVRSRMSRSPSGSLRSRFGIGSVRTSAIAVRAMTG